MNRPVLSIRCFVLCLNLLPFSLMSHFTIAATSCIGKDLMIAIDIGHSPKSPGAVSARGVVEYDFNKNIAHMLHQRLLKQGFAKTFIVTAANPEMPLHARASFASAKQADLLISIHHDSVQPHYLSSWVYEGEQRHYSDRFQGYSLFVSEKNLEYARSLKFATLLGDELRSLELKPTLHHAEPLTGENRPLIDEDKGIYRFDNLLILKNSRIPAILMECGVIVNRQEEKLLSSKIYQQNLITAIERAVLRFAEKPMLAE